MHRCYWLLFVVLLAACDSSPAAGPDAPPGLQTLFGGDRPTQLGVPDTYDAHVATPLLVVLHGFGANGAVQAQYTGLNRLIASAGILLLAPDGTLNPDDNRFWNATEACCDFYGSGVDDVAYIVGLVNEVSQVYHVDPRRVLLFGHSNGGFMSYRLACEHPEVFAALVSLAGATYAAAAACAPTEPVSTLQIHGTADATIDYLGGTSCANCIYPGAVDTVAMWAAYDGCAATVSEDATRLDIDRQAVGDETVITRHDGCPAGVDAELWTVVGGAHVPPLVDNFNELVFGWLSAHAKP